MVTHLGGGRWVIALDGEHDISTEPKLAATFDQVFATGTRIVLDLTDATFIDSTVIHSLLAAHERAKETSGESLVIVAPKDGFPAHVIDITGLRDRLVIYPDKAIALQALTAD